MYDLLLSNASLMQPPNARPGVLQMDQRIKRALELVNQGRSHPVGEGELAATLRLSPSRFAHLFRKETGLSFSSHPRRIRLAEAARLLSDCRFSVKEIAWACGYSSVPSFDRVFKKRFGASPTAYRRTYCG
jgi:AraC family transcriptional regulator of arabinose operon